MTPKVHTVLLLLMFVLVSAAVLTAADETQSFEIPQTDISKNVSIAKTTCSPDGSMYPNSDYCSKFFVCDHGILAEQSCRQGTVWNQKDLTCVHAGSEDDTCTPQHPIRECTRGTIDFIPHPTGCQWYFDCFNKPPQYPNDPFLPYQRECDYPLLFDIRLKRCVDYGNVVCGPGRKVAVWECEYLANQCQRAHCRPCWIRFPSCVGLEDGLQPAYNSDDWTPSYIYCKNNRSIGGKLSCPLHPLTDTYEIFDPVDKTCVTQWEVPREHGGYKPTCDDKMPGYYVVKETPNVAYSCPDKTLYWCQASFKELTDAAKCTQFGHF